MTEHDEQTGTSASRVRGRVEALAPDSLGWTLLSMTREAPGYVTDIVEALAEERGVEPEDVLATLRDLRAAELVEEVLDEFGPWVRLAGVQVILAVDARIAGPGARNRARNRAATPGWRTELLA
ncbi:hypothetical protein [Nocardioides sp. GY 10127]|uniref:hypothetical protein n=1 Tax=Nocardioides sp. GY 10127 TaxID=2569762 RepID=UPI0010A931D4|nr:hypothetical protein [Nocardioides sp. GY 10127]TIC80030.1 hypothetical protein E8D37_15470 [Nocardioides sp. GY 10127]